MKRVLIVENKKIPVSKYKDINSWQGEIWVCNQGYENHGCFPKIDRIGTVHLECALHAEEYKKKYKTEYKIYCKEIPENSNNIKKFNRYRGWNTTVELVNQACIENYEEIRLLDYNKKNPNKEKQLNKIKSEYPGIIIEGFDINVPINNMTKRENLNHLFVNKNIQQYVNNNHNYVKIVGAKKILIIGNSPILLEKEYGKIINNFDYVVRINDYEIDGYEAHVGTKIDCFFTGGGHKTKIRGRDISDIDCIVAPGYTQYRVSRQLMETKIKKSLGIDNSKLKIIDKETSKKIHELGKVKYATTGYQAIIYFALLLKKDVTICGFDFFQLYKRHYYDKKKISISSAHNPEREALLVEELVQQKKIKRLFEHNIKSSEDLTTSDRTTLTAELGLYNNINLNKIALFSLITNNYLEPFTVFIKSLLKHNKWFNLPYLILDLDLSSDIKKKMKKVYSNIKFIKVKDMSFYNKIDMSKTPNVLKSTFYKLELFNLKNYNKIIMLDVDMIVKGDISGLIFDRREGVLGCKCYNDTIHTLSPLINTGVVIITKRYLNEKTYKQIIDFTSNKCFNLPDQKAINYFFKNRLKYLDKKYNVEKRMLFNTNQKIQVPENDVRIYHYVGSNPWSPKEILSARDKGYEKLEKLWWDMRKEIWNNEPELRDCLQSVSNGMQRL